MLVKPDSSVNVFSSTPVQVLESCIKNCGEGFHANVAHSKELLPEMVKIVTKKVKWSAWLAVHNFVVGPSGFHGLELLSPQFYRVH